MATVSLRIYIPEGPGGGVTKTLQFDPTTTVYDACRHIRDKISNEYNLGDRKYNQQIFYFWAVVHLKLNIGKVL